MSDDLEKVLSAISKGIIEISYLVRKSSPIDLSSVLGIDNSSGEKIKKLDYETNEILKKKLKKVNSIRYIASEEEEELVLVNKDGKYLVSFDPLDGSSNIDCNVTVGTIFCVYEYEDNEIKNGGNIVLAGYSLYGGSTQIVICKYGYISMFSLNDIEKNWSLVYDNFKMKDKGNIYSINESYKNIYNKKYNYYTNQLIDEGYNMRWVGSLVADFHRTLIKSGIILYPANNKNKNGKIRLLYEAYPLAYIVEKAGGLSFNGEKSILEIEFPKNNIHQRTPIIYGSEYEMFKLMTN